MKKLCGILVIILCLAALFGCTPDPAEAQVQKYCRVLCVQDTGMIVWMDEVGNVFVKNVDPALGIKPLKTVVITFSEGDLNSTGGTFTDVFGTEDTYAHILENPGGMRLADPSAGEPTFG